MKLLIVLAALVAADAEPAGMVLTSTGKVTIQNIKGATKPALPMAWFDVGDQITTGGDGEVLLVFREDSHRERVPANRQVEVGANGCKPAAKVERIQPPQGVSGDQVTGLLELQRSYRLAMSSGRGFHLEQIPAVTPISGSAILSDRPTLTWPAAPGAKSYEVELSYNGYGPVLVRRTTMEPRLPYPEDQKPLMRGREYAWRVLAITDQEPNVLFHARFFVIKQKEADEVKRIESLAHSSDIADLALAGAIYQTKHLYDEALAIYEKLCQLAPQHADFQSTVAALYHKAGYPDKAKAAQARADELRRASTQAPSGQR